MGIMQMDHGTEAGVDGQLDANQRPQPVRIGGAVGLNIEPEAPSRGMDVQGVFGRAFFPAQEDHVEGRVARRRDDLVGEEGAVEMDRVARYGQHLYTALSIQVVNSNLAQNRKTNGLLAKI